MRRIIPFPLALLLATSHAAFSTAVAADSAPAVAVFPIQVQDVSRFTSKRIDKFTNLLDATVAAQGYPTVPRAEIRQRLKEEKAESLRLCYDEACQIEIGKAVAAQKALSSTWAKFGDSCLLSVKLYDLRKALTEFSTTQEGRCTDQGLKRAITRAGEELGDVSKGRGRTVSVSDYTPAEEGRNIKNPIVDETGFVFLTSEPSGARVFINGEEKGSTPFETELMVGEYIVVCRQELYEASRKRIKLTQKGAKIKMKLQADFGVLRVESEPSGGRIAINGEPTGQITPFKFPRKKSGKYKVTVRNDPLYLPRSAMVRLGKGKEKVVNLALKANYGSLRVTSTPAEIPIFIDGKDTGRKTPALLDRVAAGTHVVQPRSEKWNAPTQRVTVTRNKSSEIAFKMTGRYGLLKMTTVLVEGKSTTPANADVWIAKKKANQSTPFKQKMLAGTYEIELKLKDAHPFKATVTIKDGKTTTINAKLKKKLSEEVEREQLVKRYEAFAVDVKAQSDLRSSRMATGTWLIVGGSAVAVTGGVLFGLAHAKAAKADNASTPEELQNASDTGKTFQTVGVVLGGVGVAAIGAGVAFLLSAPPPPDPWAVPPGEVVLTFTEGGGVIGWHGSF